MNVPFTIPSNPDLEKAFVKETEKLGLVRIQPSSFPYAHILSLQEQSG